MDIRHFGEGYRRAEPPPNCKNMSARAFFTDAGVIVAELAFQPHGEIWAHSAPHPILFVVIAGQGFVRVGEEESPVHAGDAVVWPANLLHQAWTTEEAMTALAFEYNMNVPS